MRYLPSVEEGYDITLRLIKKSDFVLTPTTVELPVIGGRRELTVSPGLFPIKRWNGAEWLVSTMQGYSGIALSAEATETERDTAAEFGPDAYGCLGRCSVAVHQDGTALVSRPINFRLSILDEQGAPVSADQTHIYWQGADGTKRHIGFADYDVIETVLDGASVLAFNLEVTASEPGFKTFTTEIPIPAGTEEYSWEGSVTLRNSRRNLVLDFSVVNENDTLIEDAEVALLYTTDAGDETYYSTKQGRIQATIPGVTTEAFQLGIVAARDGYDVYENIIQIPDGSEDYTYDKNVVLHSLNQPGVSFTTALPWTSAAHLVAIKNTGSVDLVLLSMPEWCQGTAEPPLSMPIGRGQAFAVRKNETGSARTGTMAMEYHNTETGETVAYNVDVTQEG